MTGLELSPQGTGHNLGYLGEGAVMGASGMMGGSKK